MSLKFGTSGLRGLSVDLEGPATALYATAFARHLIAAGLARRALIVAPLNLRPGSPIVWQPRKTLPEQIEGGSRLTGHAHTAEVYAAFLTLLAAAIEEGS